MAKKLSAVAQKFSNAAKQLRATAKAVDVMTQIQSHKMLDQSILSLDGFPPLPDGVQGICPITVSGHLVAQVVLDGGTPYVTVRFNDSQGTEVQFQHVDACKDLLTYRKVAVAYMLPNGVQNLANLVRQRNAKVDAEAIRAASSSGDQTRQQQARL